MNQLVKYGLLFILVCGILYQGYIFIDKTFNEKSEIPKIPIQMLGGGDHTLKSIGKGNNMIVFLIRSDCDYCKQQLRALSQNLGSMGSIETLILSFEENAVMEEIKKAYFTDDYPNLHFGKIERSLIEPILKYELVFPYFIWFNEKGKLQSQRQGVVPIDLVVQAVEERRK